METPRDDIFEFEGFRLDTAKRLLTDSSGAVVALMPKVFDTLVFLVENAGNVVSKDELLSKIWADTIVEENNLTQNISSLRRVLGEKPGEHKFISTIPGRGYKFVAAVSRPDAGLSGDTPEDAAVVSPVGSFEGTSSANGETVPAKSERERHLPPYRPAILYAGSAILGIAVIFAVYLIWFKAPAADQSIRSVAVLPFKNSSQLPDTEYLTDGIAENVINGLSRLTTLKVMSRNSTFRFREDQTNIRQIGTQLDVDAVVTGDVRQIGTDFVINVRLIDARDERQIWGNQYVRSSVDIIAAQNDIAQAVAQNLRLKLTPSDTQLLAKRDTENPEAWQLYQRGRFHVFRLTPPEVQKGIGYFQQAIAIDPEYAPAYSGISDAYRSLALSTEMPPVEYLGRSKAAASKAIELDESFSEGHSSLGMTIFWGDWNWREAEEHYRRALELNPNNAFAHLTYAHLLSNLGRHAEAAEEMKLARELDPLFPFGNALEGQFLNHAGRPDDALVQLQKTVELAPNFWMPHLFASSAYIEKGMFAEAISSARRATELSPAQTVSIAFEGFALARSGDRVAAQANLDKLLKLSTERFVPATHIAMIYVGLDEREKALEWLEKGFEQRDPKMAFLKVEPKWNSLRSEPRFIELMRRMNF